MRTVTSTRRWSQTPPTRACFFFQAEDCIRDFHVTGVQTCALPIWRVCAARQCCARPSGGHVRTCGLRLPRVCQGGGLWNDGAALLGDAHSAPIRSEERRVGNERSARRSPSAWEDEDGDEYQALESDASHPRVFFFSSRRLHTRFSRDWSSDVCSSDLACLRCASVLCAPLRRPCAHLWASSSSCVSGWRALE